VVEGSIAATKEILHEALDFAFLDVDVTNGKTFEIARILERKHVPFVFVSASPQDQLPFELRSVPFIPKPFHAAQIEHALQAGESGEGIIIPRRGLRGSRRPMRRLCA
jgi:two-component SAPR family response regulator